MAKTKKKSLCVFRFQPSWQTCEGIKIYSIVLVLQRVPAGRIWKWELTRIEQWGSLNMEG